MTDIRCCYPDCTEKVGKGKIACWPHWRQVDTTVQRQVQWRLNGWKDKMAARDYLLYFFRKQNESQHRKGNHDQTSFAGID
jgi:hypothetical protein